MIEAGKVRINRERVAKASVNVKASDVITVVLGGQVKVVRVLGEAERRGPASDARQLYEELASPHLMDAMAKPL
jgi:ribosome-associated heat shock protein Hsp15